MSYFRISWSKDNITHSILPILQVSGIFQIGKWHQQEIRLWCSILVFLSPFNINPWKAVCRVFSLRSGLGGSVFNEKYFSLHKPPAASQAKLGIFLHVIILTLLTIFLCAFLDISDINFTYSTILPRHTLHLLGIAALISICFFFAARIYLGWCLLIEVVSIEVGW